MRPQGASRTIVARAAVACLVLTACEGGGGGGLVGPGGDGTEDVFDMAGTWTMTRNPVDPPFAFDCTGRRIAIERVSRHGLACDGNRQLRSGHRDG